MSIGFHIRLVWLALIFILILLAVVLIIARVCYTRGKKLGDRIGYIRGLRDGQQNSPRVTDESSFPPK